MSKLNIIEGQTDKKGNKEWVVSINEEKVYVIKYLGNGYTLYDYKFHEMVSKYKFYKHTGTDYINHGVTALFKQNYPDYNSSHIYLHSFIMKYCAMVPNPENKPTIDHINRNKYDNRLCNLRWATTGEQNQNKPVRFDKKLPCDELVFAGIKEIPRFIRYDNSQERFVIDKHPVLVERGNNKNTTMNATRKGSIFQKLYDAVSIAIKLDDSDKGLCEQFYQLQKIVVQFNHEIANNDNDDIEPMDLIVTDSLYIEYYDCLSKLKEIMEKKKETKIQKKGLPVDCGVTPDMIPKYCYFVPETEKRGSKFVIDRHPNLDKRQWGTSGSKSISIKSKFDELITKLENLNQ